MRGLKGQRPRRPVHIYTRRKTHPKKKDEKVKKARVDTKRRSAARAEFLAVEAARLSARRKNNPFPAEQKAKEVLADKDRYRTIRLTVEQKA